MNTHKTLIGLCCALAALPALTLPDPAHGATVTLAATEDTFISEDFPPGTGAELVMVIGTQGSTAHMAKNHGLIRFGNLASIPAGATITSVRFTMTVERAPINPPSIDFRLHRLLKEWQQATNTTWFARIAPDQNWDQPGAAAGTDFVADSSGGQLIGGSGSYAFESTPALIADLTGWVNNPASNFGWLIKPANEDLHSGRRVTSSEGGAAAPSLEVVYDVSAPVRITGFTLNPGEFCLQFMVRPGKSYVVERRTALADPPWSAVTNFGPAVAAETVTVCDPVGGGDGFYRLGER